MDLRQKILSTVHDHRHRPHNNGDPPGTSFSEVEDIQVTATVPTDTDNDGGKADGLPQTAQQGVQQGSQRGKWTEQEVCEPPSPTLPALGYALTPQHPILSLPFMASILSPPPPPLSPVSVLREASAGSASAPAAAPHSASFGAAAAAFREAGAGAAGAGGSGNPGGAAAGSDDGPTRVQRFLMRLAVALHAYGSSAARTEFLIERAGRRLGVDVSVAVLPDLILLAFNRVVGDDTAGQRTHMLSVSPDMDLDKLGRVDELARSVGLREAHNLMAAYWQLRAIANAPPTFSPPMHLLAMALMSASAAVLFFGGRPRVLRPCTPLHLSAPHAPMHLLAMAFMSASAAVLFFGAAGSILLVCTCPCAAREPSMHPACVLCSAM
ncbi:unnamed protein product [Closterium sp. NIES-64]|nr:unnamed protein product [Closterium sp. NIES-64]